ncbi:MAG: peptidoglycan DD-metalloendopeptidase family protein [Alphaproteobacteria bacterium]
MDTKIQAILRAGGICAFLGATSLTAFYGWYKAVSIPLAEASLMLLNFTEAPAEIELTPDSVNNMLEQAQIFEFSRNLALAQPSNLPIEVRLAPTLFPDDDLPQDDNQSTTQKTEIAPIVTQDPNIVDVSLTQGSNITQMLVDAGIETSDVWTMVDAMKPVYSPNRIPAGKEFQLIWKDIPSQDGTTSREFSTMRFAIDAKTSVDVIRQDDGSFQAMKIERPTVKQILRGDATITSSLYVAGQDAGIPSSTLSKLLRTFSWDIDFERDVKVGDKFSVLYQCEFDQETGEKLSCNDILYATITVGNNKKSLYSFTHKDGKTKFYSEKGFSAQKQFLRTPISMDRARISSKYGYRKHPTLGYSKMHSGTDFAAPTGTPIYAASDGKITIRSRRGSAGNMVEIVHGKYKTIYMHMSRFASGQRVGSQVKQGDVIGYVGTTGRSTGPHLHYELRLTSNGQALNSLKVTPVSSGGLSAAEAKAFQTHRKELEARYTQTQPNFIPNSDDIKTAVLNGTLAPEPIDIPEDDGVSENARPLSEIIVQPRPSDLS